MEGALFFEMQERYKVPCVKKCIAETIGSQDLFEILQTSLCVKNSEKACDGELQFFIKMMKGHKFSYKKY